MEVVEHIFGKDIDMSFLIACYLVGFIGVIINLLNQYEEAMKQSKAAEVSPPSFFGWIKLNIIKVSISVLAFICAIPFAETIFGIKLTTVVGAFLMGISSDTIIDIISKLKNIKR